MKIRDNNDKQMENRSIEKQKSKPYKLKFTQKIIDLLSIQLIDLTPSAFIKFYWIHKIVNYSLLLNLWIFLNKFSNFDNIIFWTPFSNWSNHMDFRKFLKFSRSINYHHGETIIGIEPLLRPTLEIFTFLGIFDCLSVNWKIKIFSSQ